MPKSYLSFLMLMFAAVLILVLYDSCHKPKKHINASKIYSDEQEQREMFGHTGAEAYEMMMSKKSKSDTLIYPNIVSENVDTSRAPLFESNYPALEAKGRVRSVLDPKDYNTVQEWRMPEEIVADQKWLDSFFARLDSVLSDTTKKQ